MDKLRLIQCGVGGMGQTWRKNAISDSPDFELVAIVDISPAALTEAGQAMQTLRRLVREKPVGEFGHGHIDFYIAAEFEGFRAKMEFPLLVDMSIHHMDLIRAVTGRNISRITAQSFRPSWCWYEGASG